MTAKTFILKIKSIFYVRFSFSDFTVLQYNIQFIVTQGEMERERENEKKRASWE